MKGSAMNRIHVAPPVALALLALLAGCQEAATPETFPQAAADAWLGSFNGGDVAGLVLTYSADAKILPPDEPIIAGAEAIDAFWQAYNPGQVRIEVSEVESRKLGNFWLREGAYKAQFPDEGETRVGKFMELWKQENGNWLMYRQMWNRNAPLAPAAPAAGAAPDEPA
jgi:ketosteroid isomerase-like protein